MTQSPMPICRCLEPHLSMVVGLKTAHLMSVLGLVILPCNGALDNVGALKGRRITVSAVLDTQQLI